MRMVRRVVEPAWRSQLQSRYGLLYTVASVHVKQLLRDYCLLKWGRLPRLVVVPSDYEQGPARVWVCLPDGRHFYGMVGTYPVPFEDPAEADYYWDVKLCWEAECRGVQDERECVGRCGHSLPM